MNCAVEMETENSETPTIVLDEIQLLLNYLTFLTCTMYLEVVKGQQQFRKKSNIKQILLKISLCKLVYLK